LLSLPLPLLHSCFSQRSDQDFGIMSVEIAGKMFIVGLALYVCKKIVDRLFAKTFRVYEEGIILVTGASTGIGRHSAESLAKRGYVVFAGVRKEEDAKSINEMGIDTLVPLFLDVTKEDMCVEAMKQVKEMTEKTSLPLVALVNNAGVMRSCPIEFHSLADMRRVFDTNVFGSMHLTQCAIPLLKESEGRVVNITSFTGVAAPPLQGTYAASKHAFEGFSDALRRELGPQFNISVSIVEPAYVTSNLQTTATATSQEHALSSSSTGCLDTSRGVTEENMKAMYSKLYSSFNSKKVVFSVSMASSADVTSWAITDAIVNPRPRTRYPVANAMGIPTWILSYVFCVLPDRVIDLFLDPIHL